MGIDTLTESRAVFLDRDGVINRNIYDPETGAYESPHRVEDFQLLPNVIPALTRLRDAGFDLFLVSNQPSHAKGKVTLATLNEIHSQFMAQLSAANLSFKEFYYCFHHPDGIVPEYSGLCRCRKPSPYFLFLARDQYELALSRSWLVGDRSTDITCGVAAGVRTIRVALDRSTEPADDDIIADFNAYDLAHATEIILTEVAATPVTDIGRAR